jgi:hypothetical protein
MLKLSEFSRLKVKCFKLSAIEQSPIDSLFSNPRTVSIREACKNSSSMSNLGAFNFLSSLSLEIGVYLLNWSSIRKPFDMQAQVLHWFLET